ncbi:uncharacterized protein PgNI_09240 [Pyricularia grisea]|uniref:ATP-grasp domain-containing protein n=1 Tax=Pyricularia grisea TaxID=148305 RepID=A0A6P8AS89_PYRGI|nr:uncharacterized protein PgNI_09240 [Pyricularia grisea]TLD04990.1 hypothetical protein PgNI_09240 [Pyricularia grisea]
MVATTEKEALPIRLAAAVKNAQPVDGIFTCTDDYLVAVAQTAQELGLPTSGLKPYTISTDKFLTHMFSGRNDGATFSVRSLAELDDKLAEHASKESMSYPMVCKPSTGRGSEGVFRADDALELRDAVARILALGRDCPSGVVIEPYVDGPELDVNLVMLDGQVLFSEVVDDFPSPADYSSSAAFNETQTHAPSGLPKEEQKLAVDAMVEAVLLQGFCSGVFHCEARVRNSRVDYRDDPDVPFPVLDYKEPPSSQQQSIFLHEINARSPGIGSSTASLHSTGVDYFALQLLAAVGDWARFAALSTPFQHAPTNFISLANVAVDVPATLLTEIVKVPKLDQDVRIAIPDDAFPNPQLRANHSSLMRHVVFHTAVVRPSHWYGGEVGSWRWFMTGVIVSGRGREEALMAVATFAGVYQRLLGVE